MTDLAVEKWVTWDESEKLGDDNDVGISMGGWVGAPFCLNREKMCEEFADAQGAAAQVVLPENITTFEQYLDQVWESEAEGRKYAWALRNEIVAKKIRRGGFWHQEQEGVPVFIDGRYATYSMRAWGDLMAAIWSEVDQEAHSYVKFAWTDPEDA